MGSTMIYAQQRSGHYNCVGNYNIRKTSVRFRRKATENSHRSKVVCHGIVPETLVTISRFYTDVVHLSKSTMKIKGYGCGLHDLRVIHTSLSATLEPRKKKLGATTPGLIIRVCNELFKIELIRTENINDIFPLRSVELDQSARDIHSFVHTFARHE